MARTATKLAAHRNGFPEFQKPGFVVQAETICSHFGWPSPLVIPGSDMPCCQATITVEAAQEILTHRHIENNRAKKRRKIALYAQDIRGESWMPSHQGLAFNPSGHLCDGQNRLHACIEAQKSFSTLVTFNVQARSMKVIDTGTARNLRDAQRVEGIDCPRIVSAAIGFAAFGARPDAYTHSAMIECSEILEDGLGYAAKQFRTPIPRVTIGPVIGVVVRAFYSADQRRLDHFCACLRDNVIDDKSRDLAAATLMKALQRSPSYGGTGRTAFYWRANHALANFLAGIPLQNLQTVERENFALPMNLQEQINKLNGGHDE